MRTFLLAFAAAALVGGVAQAKEDPKAPAQDLAATQRSELLVKVLYVCNEEERDWRMFSRDLGTPDFVTAKQIRDQQGKAWAAPKCITPAEARRLTGARLDPVR